MLVGSTLKSPRRGRARRHRCSTSPAARAIPLAHVLLGAVTCALLLGACSRDPLAPVGAVGASPNWNLKSPAGPSDLGCTSGAGLAATNGIGLSCGGTGTPGSQNDGRDPNCPYFYDCQKLGGFQWPADDFWGNVRFFTGCTASCYTVTRGLPGDAFLRTLTQVGCAMCVAQLWPDSNYPLGTNWGSQHSPGMHGRLPTSPLARGK